MVWWAEGTAGTPEGVGYVDQRALPGNYLRAVARDVADVASAIATLGVRGAPCIGVFAAYGVALARARHPDDAAFAAAAARIRLARPTAVNLAWAVDRVLAAPGRELAEAREIHAEQLAVDRAIGEHGAALMPAAGTVLTHCNTGPLATAGLGTALAVIVAAHATGKELQVIVDETRPLLQGARLTTYELARAGIPATLIVDGAAAATMRTRNVSAVIVGADRIARNGDTANKIGTYGVAIAARYHDVPFYVAAPRSTIDFSIADGRAIAIEERLPAEVLQYEGAATAPAGTRAYNPAFDVTPGALIAGIVTEYGVARAPYETSLGELAGREILRLYR